MGCASCKPARSDEQRKDHAARVLQSAASGHLKKKELAAAQALSKQKDNEERAKTEREAEAAKLLQRAAAAHLALQEAGSGPNLALKIPDQVAQQFEQAINTARDAISKIFSGDQAGAPAAAQAASSDTGSTWATRVV